MSEYQYYEFAAINRPLTCTEMAELRELAQSAAATRRASSACASSTSSTPDILRCCACGNGGSVATRRWVIGWRLRGSWTWSYQRSACFLPLVMNTGSTQFGLAYRRISRLQWMSLHPTSLPNTKTRKNLPEQIIAGKPAGDTAQAVMCQPQFFGK